MMGHLRHVFNALRDRRGEWTLFAVLKRPRRELARWNVVMAAPWMPTRSFDDTRLFLGTFHEVAAPEESRELGGVFIFHDSAQIAGAAATLLAGRAIEQPVGRVRRTNFSFRSRSISRGYVWAANLPTAAAVPAA